MGNWMMFYKDRHPLLLGCLKLFLRCIIMIGWDSDVIWKASMVHTLSFLPKTTLNCHEKNQILAPLLARELWWCAIRRDIHWYLSDSNIPYKNWDGWMIFWQPICAPYGQHHIILARNNSQMSSRLSDFGHTFSTGNRMMCYQESHALLHGCFIPFLKCIMMIKGASDST